jgi:hypothetical protein
MSSRGWLPVLEKLAASTFTLRTKDKIIWHIIPADYNLKMKMLCSAMFSGYINPG